MKSSLAKRLEAARGDFRAAGKILRRTRRLYIRFVWPDIKLRDDGTLINYCAKRMLETGMYAAENKPLREVRYAILRRAWRNETGAPYRGNHPDGWHQWYPRYGFTPFHWERNNRRIA